MDFHIDHVREHSVIANSKANASSDGGILTFLIRPAIIKDRTYVKDSL